MPAFDPCQLTYNSSCHLPTTFCHFCYYLSSVICNPSCLPYPAKPLALGLVPDPALRECLVTGTFCLLAQSAGEDCIAELVSSIALIMKHKFSSLSALSHLFLISDTATSITLIEIGQDNKKTLGENCQMHKQYHYITLSIRKSA